MKTDERDEGLARLLDREIAWLNPDPQLPAIRRRGARRRRLRSAAALAVAAAFVGSVALAGLFVREHRPSTPPFGSTHPSASPRPSFDGWDVAVSIEPARVGPLEFSLGPVVAIADQGGTPASLKGWVQHSFTITNVGNRTVSLTDARTSVFLGPPPRSLIASDWYCGYGTERGRVQAGSCFSVSIGHIVRPGRSLSRNISLAKDLRGMSPLTAGAFVFRQPVGYVILGGNGSVRAFTIRLTYTITPSTAATADQT
jgi:hypothetical protein